MNLAELPFGIGEIIWMLGVLVFTLGPFILLLLVVK